jgi:CRP-like cAMP-binding protein
MAGVTLIHAASRRPGAIVSIVFATIPIPAGHPRNSLGQIRLSVNLIRQLTASMLHDSLRVHHCTNSHTLRKMSMRMQQESTDLTLDPHFVFETLILTQVRSAQFTMSAERVANYLCKMSEYQKHYFNHQSVHFITSDSSSSMACFGNFNAKKYTDASPSMC